MRISARAVGFWLDCCWNGLGVRGVAEAGLDNGERDTVQWNFV